MLTIRPAHVSYCSAALIYGSHDTTSSDVLSSAAVSKFLLLAASDNLRGISLTQGTSHGVMPTISAPLIERVYMVDYYLVKGDSDRLIFWADSGLGAIAKAELSDMKLKNVVDLPTGIPFTVFSN